MTWVGKELLTKSGRLRLSPIFAGVYESHSQVNYLLFCELLFCFEHKVLSVLLQFFFSLTVGILRLVYNTFIWNIAKWMSRNKRLPRAWIANLVKDAILIFYYFTYSNLLCLLICTFYLVTFSNFNFQFLYIYNKKWMRQNP